MSDISGKLRRVLQTMTNDEDSSPGSKARGRFVERSNLLLECIAALDIPAPSDHVVGGEKIDFPKILYVCEVCFAGNQESCGNDRDGMSIAPDGRWLCDGCRDDENIDVSTCKSVPELFTAPPATDQMVVTFTQAECDELCEIAERDGYEKAVQEIDQLTGGDGEYRVSMLVGGGVDDERHTPDAPSMIQRIVDRFETLNLLHDAEKTGRDQEWGDEAEINPNCREELRQAALMIRTYIPLSFPENEAGQVHFVRAICESVADVIERALATPVTSVEVE